MGGCSQNKTELTKFGGIRSVLQKMFDRCRTSNEDFELGSTLLGIVTDWSDAETNGLRKAAGKKSAEKLLKGCKVHWQRSCQRIADKVLSSQDNKEKSIFMKICSQIQKLDSSVNIIACFEALCGVRPIIELQKLIPSVCSIEDAKFIDDGHLLSIGHNGGQDVITSKCYQKHLQQWRSIFGSSVQAARMQWNAVIRNARATHHNV